MTLKEKLRRGPTWLDGGMGTLLQQKGLKPGERSETWSLTHADDVTAIHRAYFEAGSQIVAANTFGANPLHYGETELEALIRTAIGCVRRAMETAGGRAEERYAALDVGPTGQLLEPFGPLAFEEAVKLFSRVIRIGAEAGADCVLIETMNDSYETRAALLAAKESCRLPVLVSNAYGADGKLMTGATPEAMTAMLEGLGADAIGVNCSLGPAALKDVVRRYLAAASVPVLMKPNAGLPREENGRTVYDVTPEAFAREMIPLVGEGLRILGGCCGTTPEYIRILRERAEGAVPPPLTEKTQTVVSSWCRTAVIGEGRPLIIGERINPTGRKRMKQALADGDMAYLVNEGIAQEESGADLLDVNVGMPGLDEPAVLSRAVRELQAVIPLPLQLDTSSPEAMEAALRVYNGKALINSVNGKPEVMRAVFPLMKKYGGAAVALTLDGDGIPDTAEGRLRIAQRILEEAASYGIPEKEIIFDPLTLTVSADPKAAETTLEALRLIRSRTGRGTVLGVSNISFGLPARERIGSVFLALALQAGLSAAILNPLSTEMLSAWHACLALTGRDEHCAEYIAFASAHPLAAGGAGPGAAAAAPKDGKTLADAVRRGLREEASRRAEGRLREGADPMELVRTEILPALDDIGRDFEAKRAFLPQLMMSAEAAEAAFAQVKAALPAGETTHGRVVLATVKGDLHDIGQNIVRLLLENYGFEVTDLGRDTAPERVLEAVRSLHAPLCGLSALMTTTVPAMAETIDLLHREAPWCRVMVGGAVLTEEYAEKIGADAYAGDAMGAVRVAERLEREAEGGRAE